MRSHFEEHVMPNGTVVFYRHTKADGEEDHSYWRGCEPRRKREPDGEWKGCGQLTGVSTVASPFDFRPDALMKWAARTNGIGISMLVEDALSAIEHGDLDVESAFGWLRSHDLIWQRLEKDGLTFNDVRELRADEGTNVHKHALHAMASGKPVPDYAAMTESEHGYANGVADFWLEHMPASVLAPGVVAEQVVCDLEAGVAGRLDYRGVFGARCGRSWCPCKELAEGGVCLLDGKTSGFIPLKHHVQIVGYDKLAYASGFGGSELDPTPADLCAILQVDEHGGWELIKVEAEWGDFDAAVDVYRKAGRITSAAGKARREREHARVAA